jgi:hypothetical protein
MILGASDTPTLTSFNAGSVTINHTVFYLKCPQKSLEKHPTGIVRSR